MIHTKKFIICTLKQVINLNGLTTLILLAYFPPALSSQSETEYYVNVVAKNIAHIDSFESNVWQYQRRSKNTNGIRVEIFNPKQFPKWRLLSVNDKPPSEKRLTEYIEKQRQLEKNEGNQMSLGDKLSNLILLHNIKILSQDKKLVHLSFYPKVTSLSESDQEKLLGSLTLEKDSGLLTQVVIYNIHKLNPAFSVNIENFSITMDFYHNNGQTHLEKITTNIKGKYAFFYGFQDNTVYSYSDFIYVGR